MQRKYLSCALAIGILAATRLAPARAGAPAERTAQYLESIRTDPAKLLDFLDRMPKGGDLHNHLTGAVYAESYINYAVEDGDCIDRATFKILPPPCDAARGLLLASQAISDFVFRNLVIDALSIRNFHPTAEDR